MGGSIFFLFAAYLSVAYFIARFIVPETKGKSVEEVIKSRWAVGTGYANLGDSLAGERDRRD